MFDDALLESRKTPPLAGKRSSLPIAIALHAALILALVGASTWFTGEAPEPTIQIVFPGVALVPPPPGGGGEHHSLPPPEPKHDHSVSTPSTPIPIIPTELTTDPADSTTSEPDTPNPGAGDPGLPPGPGDGPSGDGPPSVGPAGPGGHGDPTEIRVVGGDVRAPVLLHRVEPGYPESARRAHWQGTVVLEATIATSGDVQEVRVVKSLVPLLDDAALRAVREWRYRPATLNGRAVPVYLTVGVTFHIDG